MREQTMQATAGAVRDIEQPDQWAFEMKWDGIRALAHIADGRVRLISRNNIDMTATYPELSIVAERTAAASAVLDGEIVALDASGRPDFGLLQRRMNVSDTLQIGRLRSSVPVHYFVFDVLEVDGESLAQATYDQRRHRLDELIAHVPNDPVQVPPAFAASLSEAMATSKLLDLEGVVAKRRDSRYRPGTRSPSWVKLKHHRDQEVVVGGWRTGNGRRATSIGSLLLGVPHDDGFRYVGRVGTGFTDAQLDSMREQFDRIQQPSPSLRDVPAADARDAHWIAPELVGEVEFAEWTSTGRLRQPTWRGWRPDKTPADVHIE